MATRKSSKLRHSKPPKSEVDQDYSIPLTKIELLDLNDIADGLALLRFVAESTAKEIPLSRAKTLIKKLADQAWNLVHECLDSRWSDLHPDAKLR